MRTIVTSDEFFSRAAFRAKVKSPFEVVVSTLRALDAAPDATPRTAQLVARLGQPIFGHQAPNGWPETAEPWMNTGAILNRINFGMAAAANRIPGATLARWPEFATLREAPRAQQVDGVVATLLGGTRVAADAPDPGDGSPPDGDEGSNRFRRVDDRGAGHHARSGPTMAPTVRRRRRQRLAAQGFGDSPELTGPAQVVGSR